MSGAKRHPEQGPLGRGLWPASKDRFRLLAFFGVAHAALAWWYPPFDNDSGQLLNTAWSYFGPGGRSATLYADAARFFYITSESSFLPWHPLLTPLGWWLRLTGPDVWAARLFVTLIGLVFLELVYRLARRWGGPEAGWWAMGLTGVSGLFTVTSKVIRADLALAVWALALWLYWTRPRSSERVAVARAEISSLRAVTVAGPGAAHPPSVLPLPLCFAKRSMQGCGRAPPATVTITARDNVGADLRDGLLVGAGAVLGYFIHPNALLWLPVWLALAVIGQPSSSRGSRLAGFGVGVAIGAALYLGCCAVPQWSDWWQTQCAVYRTSQLVLADRPWWMVIRDELSRYRWYFGRPAHWGESAVLLWGLWNLARRPGLPRAACAATLGIVAAGFFLTTTKSSWYLITLYPLLVAALAVAWVSSKHRRSRLGAALLVAAFLVPTMGEAAAVLRQGPMPYRTLVQRLRLIAEIPLRGSRRTTSDEGTAPCAPAQRLRPATGMSSDAVVVGAATFWPAFASERFVYLVALRMLQDQGIESFPARLERLHPDWLVLDATTEMSLSFFSPSDRAAFDRYVAQCTLAQVVAAGPYGTIRLYRRSP